MDSDDEAPTFSVLGLEPSASVQPHIKHRSLDESVVEKSPAQRLKPHPHRTLTKRLRSNSANELQPPDSSEPSQKKQKQQARAVPRTQRKTESERVGTGAGHKQNSLEEVDHQPPFTAKPSEVLHPRLVRGFANCTGTLDPQQSDFTAIQRLAWPAICSSYDVVIRSETGSGKTLAYAAPLMHMLLTQTVSDRISRSLGPFMITLTPTRELSLQCESVFKRLLVDTPFIVVGALHGGESKHKEKARLRKGVNVLVCTPGRLMDHLTMTSSFEHSNLRYFVLDEADRLLDLGFENTLRGITQIVTPRNKRVLVSATVTSAVERLEHFALKQPVIRVGETDDDHFSLPERLIQHYIVIPTKHRLTTLIAFILGELRQGRTRFVVFLSTGDSVEFHYLLLSQAYNPFDKSVVPQSRCGAKAAADPQSHGADLGSTHPLFPCHIFKLHGNMTQVDRSSVFNTFCKCDAAIIFCTDVAARGLDLPNIDWIVHYDAPIDERSYIHRVGRTARIGHAGQSLLFLMPHETPFLNVISIATANRPILEKTSSTVLFALIKLARKESDWVQLSSRLHAALCNVVEKNPSLQRLSMFAYESYIRAYSSYPKQLKYIFSQAELHLGHVARSFLVERAPTEQRKALNIEGDVKREISRVSFVAAKKGSVREWDERQTESARGEYHPTLSSKRLAALRDRVKATFKRSISEFDSQ